ncbi:polyprenol phosphomannose-dependent alpha 1,6 mannosyltransferase MptB [Salinimicrobium gaetbulicola]|uniref:Polyprenol phosphomannose-dependent alpha 1,6 mannosyltransferase MptB n=1 Tax=Salinimicrobium gaetbulicola TaxID=999702 RepID=A0ABW3IJ47_9FLAO
MISNLKEQLSLHKFPLLFFISICGFYWSFGYDLDRTDFIKLFSLYAALFFASWKFFQMERLNFNFLVAATILFRLVFLFSIPNLSQDFYRFLWDGKIFLQGLNPYLSIPAEYLPTGDLPFPGANELITGMGSLSAGNPTNYPPLNQVLFALSAFIGGKSILVSVVTLRTIIIAADIGILYFGRKLLRSINLPENRIFWFLLNPFVIIELTGNLHFEGVMIFFLLAALYFLTQKKWVWSAVFLACSVSVKLIPLLFLPLFFKRLGSKKAFQYYLVVAFLILLFFLPFISSRFFENYFASINLWFQKFEFNASIYYLVREIGFLMEGYNIIQIAGPLLGFLVFCGVLILAFSRKNTDLKNLSTSMLFAMSLYLFLATTVHPWYLATPLILSIFTPYRYMLVWSFTVILSYFAYSHPDFNENLWVVGLEYLLVFGFMAWEFSKKGLLKGTRIKPKEEYTSV